MIKNLIDIDSEKINNIIKEHSNFKNPNIKDLKKNVKDIKEDIKEIKNINKERETNFIENYNNNLRIIFDEINKYDNDLNYIVSLLLLIKQYMFIGKNYKFIEEDSIKLFNKINKEYQNVFNKLLTKILSTSKKDEFLDILDEFDVLY